MVDGTLIQLVLGGSKTPQQACQQRAWMLWFWIDGRPQWQLAHFLGLNGRDRNVEVCAEHVDPCFVALESSRGHRARSTRAF